MKLKYLLIPVIAFALGALSPVALAKGHGKPQGGEHKSHQKRKSHEKHQKHEKHEKKHGNENSNKQSNDDSSRSLERAGERHSKPNKKHDCDGKGCVRSHHSKDAVAPLPQIPGVSVSLPTPPKVSIPTANPVNDLIDQTATDAKQKARERGQ